MRPDYCPIGGQPCQRMCVTPCSAQLAPEPVAWMYTGIKQDGTEHGPHLVWKPEYMDAMSASKGAKATPLYFAPPRQTEPLTIERLRDALVASRIIQPAAVEDPEEYDDGVTLHRIEALHRRIT